MTQISLPPTPGEIVRVRQRQYVVDELVRSSEPREATLVRLSCLDDDAQGEALEVLWEKEVDPEVLTGEAWSDLAVRGFDPPRVFSAYLHALRWNCVTASDARLFQSPFRAGIRIDAYQLEPLRKALLLPRVNLFIADDVGIGKTIEAGLIARELLIRKKVRDIVVACPPSMLDQWKEELENRFGLTFEILDKSYLARVRQERGYGVNPWATHTRFLVSQRLLIDEAYAAPLRDWLGDLRPGSLLILDEAHHAAPSSGAKYAIDSKITRAVRDLAPRFEHRLFLSATPHNGHSNSFSALLEILDPLRFCRGVAVPSKALEDVMVRRLKEDLRQLVGGFPKRHVKQVDIEGLAPDAPELRLSELLDRYRRLREERLKDETRRTQTAAGLLISGLQQRLLSSVEAFARTLRKHRDTVLRQWEKQASEKPAQPPDASDLGLFARGVGSDDDRATLSDEELRAEEDALIEAATLATAGSLAEPTTRELFEKEQVLLDEMTEIAEASRALPDARVRRLVDWIRENMCPGLPRLGEAALTRDRPRWNDTRVIIFTEYEDTRRYLEEQLSAAIASTDRASERIEAYKGPTPPDKRKAIKRAFNADPKKHPVRILLATDAAREGLNLQAHCSDLFHFDVPWNPSRMEQRNGRIDRKLQPEAEVFCHYFVYCQRPEDRVLRALVKKTETIKRELGSLAAVVEERLAKTLEMGIRREDVEKLEREIEGADLPAEEKRTFEEELDGNRERQAELNGQIERLRGRLAESKKWIGLEEEHFRSALSCSLELSGADPLKPLPNSPDWDMPLSRYAFPALDRREGADPTWADTMDTLRAPRGKDQKFWEWRRESPVRPVVFEDPGSMDEDVVHLHLEHRMVRRLLGRFAAQGARDDLSRACLVETMDAIPRVILLGRLSLYGPGAARLHEELISVTARWSDPSLRKGPLVPYGREAEGKTMDLLEEALLPAGRPQPNDVVQRRLQASALRDVRELLPYLEKRSETLAADTEAKLAARGQKESEDLRKILEDQKKRVAETAEKYRAGQLELEFSPEEKKQLEANRRHWGKRLAAIDRELATEPDRVRGLYRVQARRVEPVGLVFLWPLSG